MRALSLRCFGSSQRALVASRVLLPFAVFLHWIGLGLLPKASFLVSNSFGVVRPILVGRPLHVLIFPPRSIGPLGVVGPCLVRGLKPDITCLVEGFTTMPVLIALVVADKSLLGGWIFFIFRA